MKSLTKQTYTVGLSALMIVFTLTLAGSTLANWQGKGLEDNPELKQKMEAVHQSIESGDYDSFKGLVEADERSQARFEGINEENFPKLQEAHQLMQEAREKMEAAHAIMEELGLGHKRGKMPHGYEGDEEGDSHEYKKGKKGRRGFGKMNPESEQGPE